MTYSPAVQVKFVIGFSRNVIILPWCFVFSHPLSTTPKSTFTSTLYCQECVQHVFSRLFTYWEYLFVIHDYSSSRLLPLTRWSAILLDDTLLVDGDECSVLHEPVFVDCCCSVRIGNGNYSFGGQSRRISSFFVMFLLSVSWLSYRRTYPPPSAACAGSGLMEMHLLLSDVQILLCHFAVARITVADASLYSCNLHRELTLHCTNRSSLCCPTLHAIPPQEP